MRIEMNTNNYSNVNDLRPLCLDYMKILKPILYALLVIIMMTQTACSESFMGKTVEEAFSDPAVVSLIQAAERGDKVKLKQLLEQGVDINARGFQGFTPALWAMAVEDYKALQLLLENGADPNLVMDNKNLTLIHVAAGARSTEVLALVLDHGGDPNLLIDKEFGYTPLMSAISEFQDDNVDYLLVHGADINQHNARNNSAAELAISIGRYDWALKFLQLGYNFNLPNLAMGAEISQVSAEGEPDRQKVITFLKEKLGSDYPKIPAN